MLVDILAAIDMSADGVPVLLVGEPAMLAPSLDAVAAIGGRVVTRWHWNEVADALPPAARPVLLIETLGATDAALADALPILAATARTLDLPVVISLAEASIDVVAATMLSPRAQLLCDPALTDRTGALALASRALGHSVMHDRTYEDEAARLQRLNAEVARIAEVLARISEREGGTPRRHAQEVSDRRQLFGREPGEAIEIDPGDVRRVIRGRRLRDEFFGKGIFEEPGWDIVLDLFAAELEGTRVSVSSLCIAAAVAPTTALRWIGRLTEAGLLERQPDPFDRRRAFMELSERASRAMRDYVAAMRRAGLSLA